MQFLYKSISKFLWYFIGDKLQYNLYLDVYLQFTSLNSLPTSEPGDSVLLIKATGQGNGLLSPFEHVLVYKSYRVHQPTMLST